MKPFILLLFFQTCLVYVSGSASTYAPAERLDPQPFSIQHVATTINDDWIHTNALKWINIRNYPIVYSVPRGWLYFYQVTGPGFFLFDYIEKKWAYKDLPEAASELEDNLLQRQFPEWAIAANWVTVRVEADQPNGIAASKAQVLSLLEQNQPVRLELGPGVFREWIGDLFNFSSESEAVRQTPLWIVGHGADQTILSGALRPEAFPLNRWASFGEVPGLYRIRWDSKWTPDPGPWVNEYLVRYDGASARREQVYLNGNPLRLVLSEAMTWYDPDGRGGEQGSFLAGELFRQPEELNPGEFTVIENSTSPRTVRGYLYMRLPEGLSMEEVHSVELPTFTGQRYDNLLRIAGKRHLIISDLSVQHVNAGASTAAVEIRQSEDVFIADTSFSDNVNVGLKMTDLTRVELRRVTASRNGTVGISLGECREVRFIDCTTNFNNYRGIWTGFIHWHPAGLKMGNCHQVLLERHTSVGNFASGLWNDVYCTDVEYRNCFVAGNRRTGTMIELARGSDGADYRLRDSVVAWNGAAGVFVSMVMDTLIEGNWIAWNGAYEEIEQAAPRAQVALKALDRNEIKVDQMTDIRLHNNVLLCAAATHPLGSVYTVTKVPDLMKVLQNASFSGNQVTLSEGHPFVRVDAATSLSFQDLTDSPQWPIDRWQNNSITKSSSSDESLQLIEQAALARSTPFPSTAILWWHNNRNLWMNGAVPPAGE